MSWKKKFKKYASKALSLSTGGMFGGGKGEDDGQRSEAAARLVKVKRNHQAGGGQIKYNSEEWQ